MSSKRTSSNVEVIKVPTERPASRPKRFPKMPRMYLELVENKDKIKQELVNREYNPDLAPPMPQQEPIPASPAASEAPSVATSVASSAPSKSSVGSGKSSRRSSDDSDSSDDDSDASSVRSYSSSSSDSSASSYSGSSDNSSDYSDSDSDISDSDKSSAISSDDGDELSGRIKELLKEDNDVTPERKRDREEKRDKHHRRHAPSSNRETPERGGGAAPPLAELEATGVYQSKKHYPDISQSAANEQEEENLKHEMLYKFALLKKSYRAADIPEFTIHSDLATMTRSYETTLRRLSLESNVDTYKKYLIGGFMLVEYILGRFLKLDMEGFTRQQMINMTSYDRLLIELGEKSYVPGDSKWPVELRLLGMIMINAGFFVVTKMIGKMSGSDIMGMFNAFNGSVPPTASAPQAPKRRMQGPSINLDELSE